MNLPFNIVFGVRLDYFLLWIAFLIVSGVVISFIFKSTLSGIKNKVMFIAKLIITSLLSNTIYSVLNLQLGSIITEYDPDEIYNEPKSFFIAILLFALIGIITFLFIRFLLTEKNKLSISIIMSIFSLPWICFLPVGDISMNCNYLSIVVFNDNFWIFALFTLAMCIGAYIINRKDVFGIKGGVFYFIKILLTSFLSMGLVSYISNLIFINYIYTDFESVYRTLVIFIAVFAITYIFNRFYLYDDKSSKFVLISSVFTAPWFIFIPRL